jgi:competence protein ComEC
MSLTEYLKIFPTLIVYLDRIFRENLVLLLLFFYCIGILFGNSLKVSFIASFFIYVGLFISLIFSKYKKNNLIILITLFFFLFNFSVGYTYLKLNKRSSIKQTNKLITIKAVVLEEPVIDKKISFKAQTLGGKDKLIVKLSKSNKIMPEYGDILILKGKFRIPDVPTNPGQFNYRRYLVIKGISGIFSSKSASLYKKTFGNPLKRVAFYLKKRILKINRKTLPYPYGDLYTGLVFGDHGTKLPEQMSDNYQKVGLTHLLVVSGAQVALLSGILLTIFRSFNMSSKLTFSMITMCNILFYFITGGGASIFRAILMSEIILGIKFMQRRAGFYHILALTALIMLLINPLSLFDVGAYLSFMATLALVFGATKMESFFPEKLPKLFKVTLSISLAPFLFTAPILWFTFRNISPIALVSNLIVINWIEILVVTGFFSTVIGFVFLPLTQVINNFSYLIMKVLNIIVELLAGVPFSVLNISKPNLIVIVLIYFFMFFVLFSMKKRDKKYFGRIIFGGLFLFFLFLIPSFFPSSYLKVTFLDVGQGDSALIETPSGKTILIDGGDISKNFKSGEILFDTGKSIIYPALKAKGINKLDIVITTHFHKDHIGGVPYLLENIPYGIVMDNGRKNHNYFDYKKQIAKNENLNKTAVSSLNIPLEEGITLNILYPHYSVEDMPKGANPNNNSIVCRLSFGEIDFLFMGDLEKEKELELVSMYGKQLESEVLKVGHHGSKTSSSEIFLDSVRPTYAVISCGRKNRFRHPAKSTLWKLKKRKYKSLRTDKQGSIEFITDGKRLLYKTFL